MASEEFISGSDWEQTPEPVYKKPREIKPRDPNRMDRWSIIINALAIVIHASAIIVAYLAIDDSPTWFTFMFLGYSIFAITWSLKSIRKTKNKDYYQMWIVENHLWSSFFKKRKPGNTLNLDFKLDDVEQHTLEFWIGNYMKKVMRLYDHKDFNKKAYLEYQLQRPENEN